MGTEGVSGKRGIGRKGPVTKPMPKIIDPVFAKTSPKRSFSMTENERFGLAFANTGSINSGTSPKDRTL
jgi:hypothetical protein